MLSFLCRSNPPRLNRASQNPIYYEDSASWLRFYPAGSEYLCTQAIPNKRSFLNPPPHLHLYQDETFHCAEGTVICFQPTAEPSWQRTVMKGGDPSINLPAGKIHWVENASDTEIVVLDTKINPESPDMVSEERFFRNTFGYLDDCRRQGTGPSPFQMELFLWSIEAPRAIPVPGPDWLKYWVSRGVMVVMGRWIGAGLGYKFSYPEYYDGPTTSLK